jgi:hypothetical protein
MYSRACAPEMPDFSLHNIPKRGKIYQICHKITKWPYAIENINQLFFIPRPSNIYPNLEVWFENLQSGNPDVRQEGSWQISDNLSRLYETVSAECDV